MPDDELLQNLRRRLHAPFLHQLLDGSLHVLSQADNPMRAHQFASTHRELMVHVLEVMAPNADVMRCPWFKQDKNVKGPTRAQRALYTCRGGLTDPFLTETLKLPPDGLHAGLGEAFEELNKRTHVRPNTVLTNPDEIKEFADGVIAALNDVFDTIDEVRATIVAAIAKELHGQAMSVFVQETIQELSEISGHYSTEGVWIEDAKVLSLDADWIRYRMEGSVDVTLNYGSASDPAEIDENFPYLCTTEAPSSNPTKFDLSRTQMKVDTSSWHGDDDE